MVLLQVVLVVLITPSLAAGLISAERESGGWDILRMTPMSVPKILRGKILSVACTLLLVLMATLPGYLVMIYIKPAMFLQVRLVSICLLFSAVLTLSVSSVVSSFFSKTTTATTCAYIALMAIFFGPMIIWLGRDSPFGHTTVQSALMINPMGAALSVMETRGFAHYELIPASWWISGIVSVFLFAVLAVQTWRLTRPV